MDDENGERSVAGVVGTNGDAHKSLVSSLLATHDRDYLLSSSGNQVKISEIEEKIVGLYFSANWYSPCKNFNNILIGVYDQLRSSGANFEIVFVSSDEDCNAFNEYFRNMHWLAVPFSDLETKKALNKKFDIEGIPTLVILQPNDVKGDETLLDGVEHIYRHGVRAFPFTKDKLEELQKEERERHESQTLASLLTNNERDFLWDHPPNRQTSSVDFVIALYPSTLNLQIPISSLVGKTVGLYFSAQWCTPCLNFTPKLASVYQKIKQSIGENQSEDFEIVFISSDHDQASFDTYFNRMPWMALPFGDPSIKSLARYFDVQGIPCLIILGPDGKTVTKQGRNLINLYQERAYPFTGAQVEFLEKQMEEEARSLPKSLYHTRHRHELNLVSEGCGGGPFICCDCDEQGSGWAYQCLDCGYEVHPRCINTLDSGSALERTAL